MDEPSKTHMMILFEDRACEQCKAGLTHLSRLASQTKDNSEMPKIALFDCSKNQ